MSRKHILLSMLFLLLIASICRVNAEEKTAPPMPKLIKELTTRLDVSQISFSNWAKGGENSWSYTSNLTGKWGKETENFRWLFHTDLAFGQNMLGEQGVRNTQDRIIFEANITWKSKKYLNPYASFSLNTQFATGYDYKKDPPVPKSDFWDPAYLIQSTGFGFRVNDHFAVKWGFALKETFTRNFRQYSDDPKTRDVQETTRIEPGVKTRTDYIKKVNSNLKYVTMLELFSDLRGVRDIDVRWQNKLEAKVAKYVSVNLEVFLLYDRDVIARAQVKQFLGIGLFYSFF